MSTFTVAPANQSADNNAKMIYQWLSGLSERQGKKLISGIFGGYSNIGGVDAFSLQQGKDLQALTGKFPLFIALTMPVAGMPVPQERKPV